jgi:hypothetical protein
MRTFGQINRFVDLFKHSVVRLRYPFSMPEEIGLDLGLDVTNSTDFDSLLKFLRSSSCYPRNLRRYMKKDEAEALFSHAFRSDHFREKSIHCYYFKQGWVEFELVYDNADRLRRIILQSRDISADEGVEIKLSTPNK